MRTHLIRLLMLLVVASPFVRESDARGADLEGTSVIDYFGYANCIQLSNENTTVVLCPYGGRVMEYAWQGANVIYLDPAQKGWIYKRGRPTIDPCGGRFDIGPEVTIPRHPKLWFGKWKGEITGPRLARLTSPEDEATGTQLVREFTLDARSSRLVCTQVIKNISGETKRWCHWSRTLATGGGICVIPLTEGSRFPKQYLMYGPNSTIQYQPEDPNIRVRNGFLEIIGPPKHAKLGLDSYEGWFAYVTRNNLLFIKRFPTYPDRVYNEMAALTISIYYFQNIMFTDFCKM